MPRGLTIEQAAEHIGLSVSGFRHWLKRSGVKCKITGTNRYDLKAIDAALDKISGLVAATPADEFEEWEARRRETRSAAYQSR